jgi:hypothetical protein
VLVVCAALAHGWTLRTITAVLMQPKPPVPATTTTTGAPIRPRDWATCSMS